MSRTTIGIQIILGIVNFGLFLMNLYNNSPILLTVSALIASGFCFGIAYLMSKEEEE